ncbi:hypothetical protein [Campylobacter sputorum]|uniref:hypothetical protein n=1 Tax=Campylobacter sputorum TaxID=206 RepID=UPI00053BF5C3|nr:hypothetical protein [Campylobacter sputorum]
MKVRLFSILFILTIYNNFVFSSDDSPSYIDSSNFIPNRKVNVTNNIFEFRKTIYEIVSDFKKLESPYCDYKSNTARSGYYIHSSVDIIYQIGDSISHKIYKESMNCFSVLFARYKQKCSYGLSYDFTSGSCYESCKKNNDVLGNFEFINRNSDGSVSGSECNDCSKASSEAEYLDCACKANGGIGFNGSHPGVTVNGYYSPGCVSKDGTEFDIFIPNFDFRNDPSNTEFIDPPNSNPTDPTNTDNNGGTTNPEETVNTGNTGGTGGNDNSASTGSTGGSGSGSIGSETTINDNNTTHIGGNTSPVTPNTPQDNNTSNTGTTTKPTNQDLNGTSNNGNYLDTLNKILTELDSLNKKTEELITGDKDMIKSYNEFSKALSSDPDHPFNDGVGDEYKEIEIMKRGQKYFEFLNEANEKHQKELTENIKDYKDDITSQLDNFKNGAENLKETVLNPLKNPGSSTITKSCPKPVNVTSNSGFSAYTEIDVCKEISRVEPIMYTFFYLLFFGFFLFLLYKIVYRFAL